MERNTQLQHVGSRAEGQGLVEYGLIIALVAVVAIAGLLLLGPGINTVLASVVASL